jgi:hypothetical protein
LLIKAGVKAYQLLIRKVNWSLSKLTVGFPKNGDKDLISFYSGKHVK